MISDWLSRVSYHHPNVDKKSSKKNICAIKKDTNSVKKRNKSLEEKNN